MRLRYQVMASREPSRKPTAPQRDQKRGGAALLIIDMINLFNFVGGDKLRTAANRMLTPVQRLRSQADVSEVPVIYVNDNFGEWHSDQSRLVDRARSEASEIIDALAPREQDYFIIKPQLSGFYATNLSLLLPKLGVSRLVLTGIAADICVLFTAGDAHMRDYALWVPEDTVAAEKSHRTEWALSVMHDHLGAEIAPTDSLDLKTWMAALDRRGVR